MFSCLVKLPDKSSLMAKKKLYRYDDFYKSNIKDINKTREALGLKPIKYIIRECLKCDVKFESNGPNNRMCDDCATCGDDVDIFEIKKP